jgi:hypothetical protein
MGKSSLHLEGRTYLSAWWDNCSPIPNPPFSQTLQCKTSLYKSNSNGATYHRWFKWTLQCHITFKWIVHFLATLKNSWWVPQLTQDIVKDELPQQVIVLASCLVATSIFSKFIKNTHFELKDSLTTTIGGALRTSASCGFSYKLIK